MGSGLQKRGRGKRHRSRHLQPGLARHYDHGGYNRRQLFLEQLEDRRMLASACDLSLLSVNPAWAQQEGVRCDVSRDNVLGGYAIDAFIKDIGKGFATPDNWKWHPAIFEDPLIDFSNRWTGFETGWSFTIMVPDGGQPTVYSPAYVVRGEILDESGNAQGDIDDPLFDHRLPLGGGGYLDVGWFTGDYSLEFAPGFDQQLNLVSLVGSVDFDLAGSKSIPLVQGGAMVGPVPVTFGLRANVGLGLEGDITLSLSNGRIGIESATITPEATIGLVGFGEVNIGVAKGGVEVGGKVMQTLEVTYNNGSWQYCAPGSLNLGASAYYKFLLGSQHTFAEMEWEVEDWDFLCDSSAPAPPTASPSYTPYDVSINKNWSTDPANPTDLVVEKFDVSATTTGEIRDRGFQVTTWKKSGADWTDERNWGANDGFDTIGPLGDGNYLVQVAATTTDGRTSYSDRFYLEIDAVPNVGTALSIEGFEWTDGHPGDGDGVIEGWETATLKLKLKSSADVSNVHAVLTTPVDVIDISDDMNYYILDAGESGYGDGGYTMLINAESVSRAPFNVNVTYTINGTVYVQDLQFEKTISPNGEFEAVFEVDIVQTRWQDKGVGSGDLKLQGGETGDLYLYLKNTGNAKAIHIDVQLEQVAPVELHPVRDWIRYPDIEAGSSQVPTEVFRITNIPKDFVGTYYADIHIRYGKYESQHFTIPKGLKIEVGSAPWLEVREDHHNFGVATPGVDVVYAPLKVQNTGSAGFEISAIRTLDGNGNNVTDTDVSPAQPGSLGAGEFKNLTITVDTSNIQVGTTIERCIEVVSDARVKIPGEDDRFCLTGLVSDFVPIFQIPDVGSTSAPDISGDWIVYSDSRNGNSDIFAFQISSGTEIQVTTGPKEQISPLISGNLIVWIDQRNWDGQSDRYLRGNDVYGYDLSTGQEFPISAKPSSSRIIGVDGNLVAVSEGYEVLLDKNGNEDELATNLVVYEYRGNDPIAVKYTTGWTAGSGHDTRQTAGNDGDFGGGLLVFEQKEWIWTVGNTNEYWDRKDGGPMPVLKIDFKNGEVTPTPVLNRTYEQYSANEHRFVYVDQSLSQTQIVLWENGSTRQLTESGTDDIAHGEDALALGADFVIYDKSRTVNRGKLFYCDLSTGQACGSGELLTEYVSGVEVGHTRIDSNQIVFKAQDPVDDQFHLYHAFLGQGELLVESADMQFSSAEPTEGELIDVTVTVHNVNPWDSEGNVTVKLYDGDPDVEGTQQIGSDQTITGGIVKQGEGAVTFSGINVPVGWEGTRVICTRVEWLEPDVSLNNTACRDLNVQDSDTEGPVFTNVTVSEYQGDGDNIIGADEQLKVSWSLWDASGIDSTQIRVDQDAPKLPVPEPPGENYSAILGPLDAGVHQFVIDATDADSVSPASSHFSGIFEVVSAEEITVLFEGKVLTDNQSIIDFGYVEKSVDPDVTPVFEVPDVGSASGSDISGDWIVYADGRNGNSDIFAYQVSSGTEIQVTTNDKDQISPLISGNLIVWVDRRNWDGETPVALRGNDVYGYDLSTGEEFPISAEPSSSRIIGVDGNLVAVNEGYEILLDKNGNEDELATNLVVYEYRGNDPIAVKYTTGWTAGSGHDTRQTAGSDGDFGGGFLVFEQQEWIWYVGNTNEYWNRKSVAMPVLKIDFKNGEVTPTPVGLHPGDLNRTSWQYAASEHRFVYLDTSADYPQIWLWDNGSTRQLTEAGTDDITHGEDYLALGADFVIYDKSRTVNRDKMFYCDLSTGQACGSGELLTETVKNIYEPDVRADGNQVVFKGQDPENNEYHLYYASPWPVGVSRRVLVRNDGQQNLTLARDIVVPTGYREGGPAETVLAPGEQTYFTLTLATGTSGLFEGAVSVGNSEGSNSPDGLDENPFDFTVRGTVNPGNLPPTLDTISDITIDEDAAEQTVAFSGVTAGPGETQPLRVTASSNNTSLIAHPVVTYTTDQTTGSLKYTPYADQSGAATITVMVEDGGRDTNLSTTDDNATFSRTFTVTVDPVNDAPVVTDVTHQPPENTLFEVTTVNGLVTLASDVEQQSMTFSLVAGPGKGQLVFNANGAYSYTPDTNFNRTDFFTYQASDGADSSNVGTVNFEIDTIYSWYNCLEPKDVNDDDVITPADVLWIINDINASGSRELSPRDKIEVPFLDVNRDGYVAPLDILWVINYLNQQAAAGNGEGESSAPIGAAAGQWQPSQSTAHRTSHTLPGRFGTDSSVPLAVDDTSYWQRVDEAMGSFTGRQQRMFAGSSDRSAEALEDLDELAEQLVDEALLHFATFQDGN
jgi:beta propeller repeat protein